MQQADKAVAERNVLHCLHGQLVVVGRNVRGGEDRRQLVLCRGDLVVLCLSKHAELPQLFVELLHERGNSRLDRAEVMIFKLLTLRCACTEQRAACVNEVRALIVELFIDKEIFLLRADGRDDTLCRGVAEKAEDTNGLCAQRFHGAQQRGFLIQHLAAVGTERRRNVQGVIFNECVGGRVPCGVAAGFKRCAQTAGREGRSIRLALDELLAGEFHDDAAVCRRRNEAVVLLGGDAGHRLEPVRVVRCTFFNRPVLHGICHSIGNRDVEVLAVVDGLSQRLVNVLRQSLTHDVVVKHHAGENVRHIDLCRAAHVNHSFLQ